MTSEETGYTLYSVHFQLAEPTSPQTISSQFSSVLHLRYQTQTRINALLVFFYITLFSPSYERYRKVCRCVLFLIRKKIIGIHTLGYYKSYMINRRRMIQPNYKIFHVRHTWTIHIIAYFTH